MVRAFKYQNMKHVSKWVYMLKLLPFHYCVDKQESVPPCRQKSLRNMQCYRIIQYLSCWVLDKVLHWSFKWARSNNSVDSGFRVFGHCEDLCSLYLSGDSVHKSKYVDWFGSCELKTLLYNRWKFHFFMSLANAYLEKLLRKCRKM